MKTMKILVAASALALASGVQAETFGMGPETTNFRGNARGYWFTAPTDFVITSLFVENDTSTANQWAEVVRFDAVPPVFWSVTNDFTSLGYFADQSGSSSIATSISVQAGDIIGILGSRRGTDPFNSYGDGGVVSDIFGTPVTVQRLGMDFDLQTTQARDIWREDGLIGRVSFTYEASGPTVPEPATWGLMIAGFAIAGGTLRRRKTSLSYA